MGSKRENAHTPTSLPRPSGLDFTKTHAKPLVDPKQEQAEAGLGCTLFQRTPPNPVLWTSVVGSRAPRFQSWAGLAPFGKETSGSLGTLPRQQGWAPGEMPPHTGWNQPVHLLHWRPDRGRQLRRPWWQTSALPGSLYQGAPRVGWRPAAGEGPVGKKGSPFAFTCHRGSARRSPWSPAVGSALSRLWRCTQRVERAPHVARRASFTQPSREEGERSWSAAHVTGASEYQLCPDGVCACAPRRTLSWHLGPARGKPRPRSSCWEEFQHAQPQ